jgi:hypothetical protein
MDSEDKGRINRIIEIVEGIRLQTRLSAIDRRRIVDMCNDVIQRITVLLVDNSQKQGDFKC